MKLSKNKRLKTEGKGEGETLEAQRGEVAQQATEGHA